MLFSRTSAPMRCRPAMADKRRRLLRTLATLGDVSDRTLCKQLAWIRGHPEVHTPPQACMRTSSA